LYFPFDRVGSREEKDRHDKTETKKTGPKGKNEEKQGENKISFIKKAEITGGGNTEEIINKEITKKRKI